MDLMILGVDGVDSHLLEEALEKRDMPNFARLKREGFFSELDSTVPAVTVPAWQVMFSGYDPGRFDAYHINRPDFDAWEMNFQDSERFRGDFFWDRTAKKGLVHFVPGTSPVYPISGVMRGGFLSPGDLEVYPEELENELEENVDTAMVETHLPVTSSGKVEAELENHRTEREIFDYLFDEEMDYAVSVVRVTDSAAHKASKKAQIFDVYEEVDETLGKMMDLAEENDADLLVASDHGFMNSETKFNVSEMLRREGLLEYSDSADSSSGLVRKLAQPFLGTFMEKYLRALREFLDREDIVDSSGGDIFDSISRDSRVVPMHFGLGKDAALKVHTADMPHGNVSENEREEIVQKVEEELEQVSRDDQKVVEEVWRGEELYSESENRPDIVFRTRGTISVETAPGESLFQRTSSFTHRPSGIFGAMGPSIDSTKEGEISIYDIAPLVYTILEGPVPEEIKGEIPEMLVKEKVGEATSEVGDLSV